MAAIRHSLQRDVFQPNDERIVGVVSVAKSSKKKKTSFLCAVVSAERPVHASICQVKKSDKDVYKKRATWPLRELKMVDGKDERKNTADFDLHLEKVYKWTASNVAEKLAFISCLWKLCAQHLPRQKPSFVNIPKTLLEETVSTSEGGAPAHHLVEGVIEVEDYQALSPREEADLEKLMAQCEFAICNAEAFTEQLAKEVSTLDCENVHTIMASDQRVQGIMQMLQAAIDEATRVEERLDVYDNLLKNVRDSVLRMEEKDTLIQIQNKNHRKLLDELENMVNQLDLSHQHQMVLLDGDLKTSEGVAAAAAAANALQKAMNAQIHPSLCNMSAFKEQMKLCEKLRAKFTTRLAHHLNNLFVHLGNERGENLSFYASELTLPKHTACHGELMPYTDLMHWLKVSDPSSYNQLTKVYTCSLSKLYEQEITWFFEQARENISGKLPLEKDKKGRLTGSSQELVVKPLGKPRSSSLLGNDPEHFGSDLDLTERELFDKLTDRMLSVLEPVCLAEQEFCVQFFGLASDIHPSSTYNSQLSTRTSSLLSPTQTPCATSLTGADSEEILSQKKEKQINEEVSYSMYLLVRLSQHVMSAQDAGSFLSKTFGNALVQAKRNFDKFMQSQMKSIEEAKVSKKSKCGILPFITNFQNFSCQAEKIFQGSERHADLDKWYTKLVHAMFDAINRIAVEHLKTPQEVVLMENFHHLYTLLYQLKIVCLEAERKEAQQKYKDALQTYVTKYFGRPLEKLNLFFDGVQSKVAQGVKVEEVSFQLAYNKQELRKVIKEYPGKEVKKGLESLYKKVEKHLCEEENLLQVVWHSMQDEFIRQYKYIEGLIERCYPGSMIILEFTINDILEFFSEIARSH
ncbi:exocyst complex component Sec3 isoform X2 [Tachypleus tridentatus]|uniref:exocyst complex component Sec3 isoform X2 n=1 Tax=Tachypleus tridentatus TaxID=6853 RepID=UPI003FCFC96D